MRWLLYELRPLENVSKNVPAMCMSSVAAEGAHPLTPQKYQEYKLVFASVATLQSVTWKKTGAHFLLRTGSHLVRYSKTSSYRRRSNTEKPAVKGLVV